MLSSSEDCTVRLWNMNGGVELCILSGHTSCVRSVAFSDDGMKTVSVSDKKIICIHDLFTGSEGSKACIVL